MSLPDFQAVRDRSTRAGRRRWWVHAEYELTGFGEPRQLRGRLLTADYFGTLGVTLAGGREFTRAEEQPGAGFVVIPSSRLWDQLFNRRPEAIGSALAMNGHLYTVVGVLPPFSAG